MRMKSIKRDEFEELVQRAVVRPRLRRELRFVPEAIADWDERELLAVADRTGNNGVLLIELDGELFVAPYRLLSRIADKTGRAKPITCDFCYTWQRGGKAGRITFTRLSDGHSLTFLCCADLACSIHVRNKTPESLLSRTQLHEDIDADGRARRLQTKLRGLVATLGLLPVA